MHGTAVTFKVTAVFENSRTCRYFKDIYALRSLKINGYKRWAFFAVAVLHNNFLGLQSRGYFLRASLKST